jgi:hypothetical protein
MQEEKPEFLAKSTMVSVYDDTRAQTTKKMPQNA